MRLRVRNSKNLLAGLIFAGFGATGLLVGQRYAVGTAFRMGPGYVPLVVNAGLLLLGLCVAGTSFAGRASLAGSDETRPSIAMRPLVLVLGAVVLFALMVRPLGLVPATVALVVVARLGGFDFKLREVALLCLVLAGGAVLVFIHGLGLPLTPWPD